MPGQNVVLTAQWSNIVWLSCCPNGGYIPDGTSMRGISCSSGDEVLAPEPLYIRDGYSVDRPEWNTKAEKTGISYYTNDIIAMTSNLSIYVQWKAAEYIITYYLDGGTNDPRNPSSYKIEDHVIFYNASKTNYEFNGWVTDTGEAIDSILPNTRIGNINLIADWYSPPPPATDIIDEFQSDDPARKHGFAKNYIVAKKGIVTPEARKFRPGIYALTAVGGGATASENTEFAWGAWRGYNAGGGSGAFLSGYIEIDPSDSNYTYGEVSIRVTQRYQTNSNSFWPKDNSDTIVSASNSIYIVAGGGKRGSGNEGSWATGGVGGVISSIIGLSANGILTANGNQGDATYGTCPPTFDPGAPGGFYANRACKYGGGGGCDDIHGDSTSYNPGYGFVHIKRVGDRMCRVTFNDGYTGQIIQSNLSAKWSVLTTPLPPTHTGYTFNRWTGVPTSNRVESDLTCIAEYTINKHNLTLVADPSNGGTVVASRSGPYDYGSSVQVTATPNANYQFVSWSDGGAQSHNVTIEDHDMSLTATFRLNTKNLTIKLDSTTEITKVYYKVNGASTWSSTTTDMSIDVVIGSTWTAYNNGNYQC